MKSSAQDRTKLIIATVITTLALLSVGHSILYLDTPSQHAKATATQTAESVQKRTAENRGAFDPTLGSTQLLLTESKLYEGTERNIFSTSVENPAKQNPAQPSPSAPDPKPRISSPPFGLRFFGFATAANSQSRVFLSLGNDIFMGSEGDIVDRRYKIIRIAPESVDVEDLLDDSPHTILIQQG